MDGDKVAISTVQQPIHSTKEPTAIAPDLIVRNGIEAIEAKGLLSGLIKYIVKDNDLDLFPNHMEMVKRLWGNVRECLTYKHLDKCVRNQVNCDIIVKIGENRVPGVKNLNKWGE